MSFFKKLISREELSEEQIAEKERVKEEKRLQRESEAQARQAANEAKKQAKQDRIEKFFGPNPGFNARTNFSIYQATFDYIESMISPDEKILGTLIAEFDKSSKREIKGVLVATDHKLIFASITFNNQYNEVFEYKKMNGISLKRDGFTSREIIIDYGRSTRIFDDVIDGKELVNFLEHVKNQIALHKSSRNVSSSSQSVKAQPDKFEQLEKLGKLKQQGILNEEEFNIEKAKILNN